MFQNKNVVVTGAGRGIGRALALGFAKQGAVVLVPSTFNRTSKRCFERRSVRTATSVHRLSTI